MEFVQKEINVAVMPEKPQSGGFSALAMERHYTVGELSKLWFFSENTIRRMFIHEPGVIKITRQATRVKRGYTSLRIPERIAEKVHRRLQTPA
jgi:hypothetical protein